MSKSVHGAVVVAEIVFVYTLSVLLVVNLVKALESLTDRKPLVSTPGGWAFVFFMTFLLGSMMYGGYLMEKPKRKITWRTHRSQKN